VTKSSTQEFGCTTLTSRSLQRQERVSHKTGGDIWTRLSFFCSKVEISSPVKSISQAVSCHYKRRRNKTLKLIIANFQAEQMESDVQKSSKNRVYLIHCKLFVALPCRAQ